MGIAGIDESRLRHAFLEEAEELLEKYNESLQGLEAERDNRELLNEAFRTIHSLKSESALLGYTTFSELAHRMEDVLGAARDSELALERPVLDTLLAGSDIIAEMLSAVGRGGGDGGFDTGPVLAALASLQPGAAAAAAAGAAAPAPSMPAAVPAVAQRLEAGSLGEAERRQLAEARDRGEVLFRLTFTVDESEHMKFARSYLVFTNLELTANVISSAPPMDGDPVEDSLYGRTEILMTSREEEPRIRAAVGVDQISQLEIERMDYSALLAPTAPTPPVEGEGSSGVPAAAQSAGETLAVPGRPPAEKTTIRVDTRKLDDMWSSIADLFLQKSRIGRVYETVARGGSVDELREELGEAFDSLEKISSSMQQSMMETRMVPISVLFSKFPRLVRDLSRKLGKSVSLALSGEETEIDRGIVEVLSDPLTHIIRNSLDHGIEFPEERVRHGKPEKGTVRISAFQQGGNIVIEIEDDGKGIDISRVREKARKAGIAGAAEMSDARLLDLIFLPGFSTRDVVTELSGRGVGMDVVATRIRTDLKGDVRVRSETGEGTLTTLVLPLTLTIVNALLIRADAQMYAIPIAGVESTAKILNTEIRGEGGRLTCAWMGEEIPLFYLGSLQGHRLRQAEEYFAVILRYGMEAGCLIVDELLEEQEVVIRPIDDLINYRGLFSGCSVLEDGTLVFVLDTSFVQGGIL